MCAINHSPGRDASIVYRIAFLNTHPIQYFAPLYAHLAQRCGFDVTALYLSDFSVRGGEDPGFGRAIKWDVDLLKGYHVEFLRGAASRHRIGGFFSVVAPELWRTIRDGNFDAVVIHGHHLAAHHLALAAAKSVGSLVFARGETHLGLKRAAWRNVVRRPLLKAWYKAFDGFLAIGTQNARYYLAMGVEEESITLVPYTVDNNRFIAAAELASQNRAETRARLGLSDVPAILYAAKFERRKRPADLIAAFSMLKDRGLKAQLIMVGSGELEKELRSMVMELNLKNVVFAGFVNQSELPSIYAACDVFVLPSENEPWGLAVNEAMCAGLPIVLSEEIGCVTDLVQTGVNGATFAAGNVSRLFEALLPIVSSADLRAKYGAASVNRIKTWSYIECGVGLRRAIEFARSRQNTFAKPRLSNHSWSRKYKE